MNNPTRPIESATVPAGAPTGDELHRAQASFHTLLEVSPELVVSTATGTVVYANPAVVRALGLRRSTRSSLKPLVDLFHIDERATVVEPSRWHASAERDASSRSRSAGARRTAATGRRRRSAAPIDFDGAPAVVVVARDVSERVQFQHQLLQRDRMAALGTLSAGVAHEINNPLTYLLVNLEHVLRRLRAASASDDPVAELAGSVANGGGIGGLVRSLQQAVEGANRVRQIVRDLLTFSQGNVEQRGVADVRGIAESAVQMAWHEIRHRARLVKSLAEVPPVDANEARLGQVFLNLLVNAAQAIPEGHADTNEIRVATRTDDKGNAVVEVGDTGVGHLAGGPAARLRSVLHDEGRGRHGAGPRAVARDDAARWAGEIEVDSTPGHGTTFRVAPAAGQAVARSGRRRARTTCGALPRLRVLVIDDERLVGEAIARSLAEDNDVEVVTEAQQALARIESGQKYDVVLCDLMMPVMTGMDLYAEIVRRAPQITGRIVFMTGGAFTPRARSFLENVVNPCLEKPLDMSKLRSIIAKAGRE